MDVASAYWKAIQQLSSFSKFTFCCDNCSAQNKNWTLISCLWQCAERVDGPEKIELRYWEKGHTYMRPDAVHGTIGFKTKKIGSIYDWNDLTETISQSSKKKEVITIDPSCIFSFTDLHHKGSSALPKISSLKVIKVKRDCRKQLF